MRIPSMTSIPHGSASIMHLRKLENGYARALDRSKENEDIVHLEEMSHSERMEFLKHDGALRQLQQDNERADFAKVEVTRVLDRVRSIRKDMQSLYNLELKIDKCTMLITFYLSQLRASLIAIEYEAPIDSVKSKVYVKQSGFIP